MLYVFFLIKHASRQVVHVHVTPHPTASWTGQQIVECCACDRVPALFLIHDRDSCYGSTFDRRVRNIGIAQIRTPYRSPRANAIAERWVRSVRIECLHHMFIFNEEIVRSAIALRVGDTCASSERSRSKAHHNPCTWRRPSRLSAGRMMQSIKFLHPTAILTAAAPDGQ